MDNPWFPSEFTWENVSRKMAEFGFKRSPKKCKDKFEEETRTFTNNSNKSNILSQNYRFFSELEALYNSNNSSNTNDNDDDNDNGNGGDYDQERNRHPNEHDHGNDDNGDVAVQEEKSGNDDDDVGMEEDDDEQGCVDDSEKSDEESTKKIARERKRQRKFEMVKGFCEKTVNKMMAQQEELHCKILGEMFKREDEKFAREDGWRKHEIHKITQEFQVRAHEQSIVWDRQAKLLGFLDKFCSQSDFFRPASTSTHQSSMSDHTSTEATGKVMDMKSLENRDDTGRRWPRDEVVALINIRCSLFNNNGDLHQDKEYLSKCPLWESISQKMAEFGYKRSAKRCKEKWENINKYFRKTKDLNKKRSIDSRTCPYFHQLTHLYNHQAPLLVQPDRPVNPVRGLPDNQSLPSSDAQAGFNAATSTTISTLTLLGSPGNEAGLVQESTGFGFEF